MADIIFGKNVLVQQQQDDLSWLNLLCGTDMTFTYEPEFITKTGPNSPSREYQVRIEDCSMSVTGATRIANDSTTLTFFSMMATAMRRTKKSYRAKFVDETGAIKTITMDAFIGQSTINGPVSDASIGTIELRGTGGFTIATPDPDPSTVTYNLLSDWWNTSNGNAFINGASAVNSYTLTTADTILEVDVEGVEFDIVTGAPGNRQAQPSLATNKINFNFTFDGTQKVFVLFKRPA